MKKQLKKIIILLVILTIALITAIFILQYQQKNNKNNVSTGDNITNIEDNKTPNSNEEAPKLSISSDLNKSENESTFYTLKQHINKYYQALENGDTTQVYNLLNEAYINEKNINISNIYNKLGYYKNGFKDFRVNNVYFKQIDETGKIEYYVLGEILSTEIKSKKNIYMIISVDGKNNTFAITPSNLSTIDINQYYKELQQIAQNDGKNIFEIAKNEYNKYEAKSLETQNIIKFYLNDYTMLALYSPEDAYNILNEDYRNKRFGSIENYKEYIENNKSKFENVTFSKYGVELNTESTQYTIVDNNNCTYVFNIKECMSYSVISDMYTVDIDSVIENYDNASDEEKVQINIQKLVEALNNNDYKYVYSKLSEESKISKYSTIELLKNDIYIEASCITVFGDFYEDENIQNRYIYNVKLNSMSSNSNNIDLKIIMDIKADREFSFDFEKTDFT